MRRKHLLIAAFDCRTEAAGRLRDALSRKWTEPARLQCIPITPAPGPEQLRIAGALIVVLDLDPDVHEVLELIDAADQAGVPALILRESTSAFGAAFAGVFSIPASSSVDVVIAALEGLMHGAAEARRLRADLALAHRCHGGIEGEMVRIHEELQLAAMIQRELLPRELPEVHGVTFGTLWRPANYVSGDIFDVARLDEDHAGVFLADSVGHGVPAALMTMVISRALVMKEVDGDHYRILPPSEVLSRLNAELLVRQGRSARFATGVYAVVDCRRRIMKIAGAGHPPPLLVRGSTGEVSEIETSGGLLGIFKDDPFEQIEIELALDDRVLFYSDGFEQAFPEVSSGDPIDRFVPTSQYRREFESIARSGSPREIIEGIRSRLDTQHGSLHQADDLTLICAHAGPIGQAQQSARIPTAVSAR